MAASSDKLKKYKSLYSSTLSTGIGTGTTDTITPASVTGLPTDTAITLTFDRVNSGGEATPTKMERIKGVISGGNLTSYVRAIDGSTEQAHTAGAVIEMIWNAADWNDLVDWGLVEHNQDGTHSKIQGLDNNQAITQKDSSGTARDIAKIDSSNVLEIGDSNLSDLLFNVVGHSVIYATKSSQTSDQSTTSTTETTLESFSYTGLPKGNIFGIYLAHFKISAGAGTIKIYNNTTPISMGDGWIHDGLETANQWHFRVIPFYINNFAGGNLTLTVKWFVDSSSMTLYKRADAEGRLSAHMFFVAGLV